jgi:hypothetical protein
MPAWGLATVAAKVAANPVARKAAQQAAGAVAQSVGKASAATVGKAQAARRQRALAHTLARQVHGQLSKAVFIGSADEHWVVWKNGAPMAAFPSVKGDLADKAELAHVTDSDRFEPPSADFASHKGTLRDRLPGGSARKKPSADDGPAS